MVQEAADVEKLSFYGLAYCLHKMDKFIDGADQALLSEKPSHAEQELADRKDELLEVQGRLRRAMGAQLETPSLTKREKPLAENFLQKQLSKLEKSTAGSGRADVEEKAARAIERLRRMLDEVKNKPAVAESAEVREIQAEMQSNEAIWKEVSPIYEKWEKGKHSFKSSADLMAMRRRYEDCRKGRETAPERLEKALRAAREGKVILQRDLEAPTVPKGWAAVAKKAPAATATTVKKAVRKPAPPRSNAWGAAVMNFAQRLRAEASAQVLAEARANEDQEGDGGEEDVAEDDEGADDSAPRPPPPPPPPPPPRKAAATSTPIRAKQPPPLPAQDIDSADEDETPTANASSRPAAQSTPSYTASAKKKGKASKKKKGGTAGDTVDFNEDAVPDPSDSKSAGVTVQAAAWATRAKEAISGSVLQELLTPSSGAWSLPDSEDSADERLAELSERLSWSSILGLVLPLTWAEFAGLEVDGGPKRTSKKGTPQWVQRVEKNVTWLLAHYITIVFLVTLLHALSHFGLLLWITALQVGLILAPPSPYLPGPNRVLALQGVHLVLWLLYVRSLWEMHFIIKCLAAMAITGHAYAVAPPSDS